MTSEELELYRRELERLNEKHERDRRHYRTLSCRVPVETAQRFAKLCFRYGKTPYRALKDAVEDALRYGGV